ncbi:hypothetical protein B0T09DRAFT_353219 [Sordaria sp. MPI-SDFR-AT-0083]|nr:hypothetical protein B0T09DRAFT_353219 [Sordaria sp. MPI-SDFR-AT-0083]
MRASFALLPALAAMTMASRCRPRTTTTSSLETSTLTSAVPTTTESSTVEPSTVEPSTTEPVTSEPATTSEPPTTTQPLTTTEAPTTTEEPTTTSVESTTSSAPIPAPTVTGFCLKVVTPDVPNRDYHIRQVSPSSNMLTESPEGPNYGFFDLDISTGKLTVSGGPYISLYAGYEVYAPPPFNNQNLRPLRFTNMPVDYPVVCSNPDGVYTSGSVLKCEVSAPWADGVMRKYSLFNSGVSSPVGAWSIMREDYVRPGSYNFDVAMFYGGNECLYQK